jgi:hypothetical protein
VFQPAITYTVPPGWRNMEDLPGNFWLYRASDPQEGAVGGSYLGIYQNARAAAISCAEAPKMASGRRREISSSGSSRYRACSLPSRNR